MPIRFSETPDHGSILSNIKGNKGYKGSYCTANKPSHFQGLKREITNKPISDSNFKIKFHSDASQLGKYGVQGTFGPS